MFCEEDPPMRQHPLDDGPRLGPAVGKEQDA
jgi:hypothetical protein